ncbi:MAG TPA: alpha-ketoglutarate-dependent dioxygenase AlkB [Candidatus Limnocylindria bacterium]|nr:alpha-ketoglutarate-dependent dioxygenase AlkB [Candidatus Limnocylindria bacterium]
MSETDVEAPEGFAYEPDFLTPDEERELVATIERLPFAEIHFRGVTARRRVVHLGWLYDYDTHALAAGPPVPAAIEPLRVRAAQLAGLDVERLEETLVTEYRPGATIGWHRDAPIFGSRVVGVSLLGRCRMRFRRKRGEAWQTYDQTLEPRSAYLLSGAARQSWQHSIPPTRELRYSITFRTVRHAGSRGQ